jgi:hypothetical protein
MKELLFEIDYSLFLVRHSVFPSKFTIRYSMFNILYFCLQPLQKNSFLSIFVHIL